MVTMEQVKMVAEPLPPRKPHIRPHPRNLVCELCGLVTDNRNDFLWSGWMGYVCYDAATCRQREYGSQDPRMWSPWERQD